MGKVAVMGFIIRLVCLYIGVKLFGLLGIILGFVAGHFLAKGIQTQRQRLNPELRRQIESTLFSTSKSCKALFELTSIVEIELFSKFNFSRFSNVLTSIDDRLLPPT